ncbi:MAG: SCO6880 family protein, partial [Acidimicrobiales bacterium]
ARPPGGTPERGRARLPGRAPAPGRTPVAARAALPPALAGCRLLAPPVAAGGLRLGVVHDARARTYSGVVAVAGGGFPLLEPAERERRVGAWSGLLAGLARDGTLVHRLQWVERGVPGDASALREQAAPLLVGPDQPATRSYAQVVDRAGAMARRHEILLALSVHADRAARQIRAAGGGDEGACAVLSRELQSLQLRLAEAEILVLGPLAPRVLVSTLRQPLVGRPGTPGPGPEGAGPAWPWPLGSEASWSAYRTEETWHATYWVAEWPRVDVGPEFLAPLLLHSGVRHAMALTMAPVSPLKAARDVQQARTADMADAELRRRGGFLTNARRQREAEVVARREVELADGHAQFRFSGYVTATAASEEALEADCARLEQAAGQVRLELRRLFGQQAEAFTWTLPLARGLA